jgi:hypothetical protein
MRSRLLPTGTPVSVFLALALASTVAFAQPADKDKQKGQARAIAEQGIAAYKAKNYDDAIDLFQRAEALYHAPTHVLMIARAQKEKGRLVLARENYLKVTREQLPANASDFFKKAVKEAEAELADLEPKVPQFTLTVLPKGLAELKVKVDGQDMPGALVGVKAPIDPGSHTFKISAKGYRPVEKQASVKEGGTGELTVELEKLADVAPDPNPPGGDKPSGGGALAPAGIALMSIGGAGVALGGVMTALHFVKRGEADEAFKVCPCGPGTPERLKVESLDNDANAFGTTAIVGFVAGAAILGTGVALFVVGSSKKPAPTQGVRIVPIAAPRFVGVAGSF